MTFVLDGFDLLTGSRNNKSIKAFHYSSTDASTDFLVAGYFNQIRTRLGIGDIITAFGSSDNKTIQLQITALTPDVTVTDISHGSADGDVKGPGISVNNEIPVFNGVTGKIVKQSGLLVDVTTPTFFNQAVLFMNEGGTGITVDPDGFFAYDRVNKAFVTGGGHNSSGVNSACVAGQSNNATALNSGSFAGANALISNTSIRAATLGGNQHQINGIDSVSIGGNNNNISSSDSSVMAGGGNNTITNGVLNSIISSAASTITDSTNANIFGGTSQVISAGAHFANIIGGDGNFIGPNAANAIILGGSTNAVRSPWGCAGGDSCDVSTTADNSFAYGEVIEIKGTHSVSFGRNNTHTTGSDYSSTFGQFCNVEADHAHSKGYRAKALHVGSFVFADTTNVDFTSTVANEFSTRFVGGHRFTGGGKMLMSMKDPHVDGDVASYQLNPYLEEFALGFYFKWKDSFGNIHKQIIPPEEPIIIPNTVADYTAIDRDKGRTHVVTQAGINTFRFSNDVAPGGRIKVVIAGGGTTTFGVSGGSVLHSASGLFQAAVDGTIDAVKIDATNWYLSGDLV